MIPQSTGKVQSAVELPMAVKGLTITATPIGNLGDLAPRAKASLEAADIIACEDTRHTGLMLHRFSIAHSSLVAYHDHSPPRIEDRLIAQMHEGARVVLVSDAGTPLIADPGYRLVRRCLSENLAVTAIPGPSALLSALVLSGFPTDSFFFAGFLPNPAAKRRIRLAETLAQPYSTIIYESPKRLIATLGMVAELAPKRELAVGRELTKLHEAMYRGNADAIIAQLTAQFTAIPKGEITLILSPAPKSPAINDEKIIDLLIKAKGYGLSTSNAVRLVHDMTGIGRKHAYALALTLDGAK